MAITINALTTGTGGLETTADASGSFSFQSDGTTIATVTSSGFSVTGTFNAGSLQVGGSDVVVDTDIGSTVQAYDADLTTLGGLSSADGNFIVGSATGWVAESGATARTSLGLGTAATTASTDYATAAQGSLADSALQPADIGSTVQAYDADTAKLDTAQTWTATQTYGDNVKQQFGASNDLEIYHNGTASYINDTGTGNLIIGSASSLVVQDPTFTTTSAVLTPTGSAKFTYNGATKLETSNTGVTVTGTVAATAFTGDGSGLTGISAGGFSNVQTFTSPGTWTNPGSVTKVKVTVVGGGGGGSGSNQPNPAVNRSGAGGGGGGTAIEWITIPTSPVPVTIGGGGSAGSPTGDGGNGGTSSFGAYCSATGGTGGDCQPSSPGYPTYVFGGIGGAGSGGNLNLPGQTLGWHPVGGAQGQSGGQSMLGTGGMGGQNSPRGTKGDNGNNYGGGGGGYGGPGGSFTGGGAGASGVVIVEY